MTWIAARKKLKAFLFKRSNGVRVSWRVHRLIRAADRARDHGEWERSARLFEKVLLLRPSLNHVHVQHGHALKEVGRLADAYKAYSRAVALAPGRRDPRLHLGHAAKLLGAYEEAASHYLDLLIADLTDAEASAEFSRALSPVEQIVRDRLLERLKAELPAATAAQLTCAHITSGAVIAFDLSDLLDFFTHARRPTGIQRVQIETVAAALSLNAPPTMRIAICCMPPGVDEWRELPLPIFTRIAELSRSCHEDGTAWRQACSMTNLALLMGRPVQFDAGSCLVNLGASWWLGNYFLALRNVRARHGLRYIPFLHDLIPVVHPQFHSRPLIDEFKAWLRGAIKHADRFLTNSLATRRDLKRVAQEFSSGPLDQQVSVVPLDAHTPMLGVADDVTDATVVALEPFVLFVGTIEPRKGHAVAFDAWSTLLRAGKPMPRLICVSGKGWGAEAALDRLRADPRLAARIAILSDVDDATLDSLYRRALFTIYPSLYEGWGLPVSEALARGKVVITTTASALPEAGGSLALYVAPGDVGALADAVLTLIDNPDIRIERERRIAREYRPRAWTDIARQIVGQAVAVANLPSSPLAVPVAIPNHFYHLGSSAKPMCDGEIMRTGEGWFWPQPWGTRVRAAGGTLAFSLPPVQHGASRKYILALLLRGAKTNECQFGVIVEGRARANGRLSARDRRWVFIRLAVADGATVRITISGKGETDTGTASFPGGSAIGVEGWLTMHVGDVARCRPVLTELLRDRAADA